MNTDLLLGIIIGFIAAFLMMQIISRTKGKRAVTVKELEEKHEVYRKQVDDHFVNTAVLFKGLYRDVYRHIAEGADELCSDEVKSAQIDLTDTVLLGQKVDAATPKEEVAELTNDDSERQNVVGEQLSRDKNVDDIPLASEVEMSAEMADEIKNKARTKV